MSNKVYTDQQMQWGAQIGYYDFSQSDINKAAKGSNTDYPTLQNILLQRIMVSSSNNIYNVYCHHVTDYYLYDLSDIPCELKSFTNSEYVLLNKKVERYKALPNSMEKALLFNEIQTDVDGYASTFEDRFTLSLLFDMNFVDKSLDSFPPANWKLYDVEDNNDGSGLYASTVLTGENDALVCYRGSERQNSPQDELFTDWIISDLGIALGDITIQENEAAEYLKVILSNDSFYTVATTGHSLGGNLALMAPVIAAGENTIEKFIQGCSFDGPGNPNEVLDDYKNNIGLISDRLYHYTCSMVGALYSLDSVAMHNCEIELTKANNNGFISNHFLSLVRFDSNGMVIPDTSASINNNWCDIIRILSYNMDTNSFAEERMIDYIINPTIATAEMCLAVSRFKKNHDIESFKQLLTSSKKLEKAAIKMAVVSGTVGVVRFGLELVETIMQEEWKVKDFDNTVDLILDFLLQTNKYAAVDSSSMAAAFSENSASSASSMFSSQNNRIRRIYDFSSGDVLDFDTDDSIQRWNDFRNEYELYVQTVLAELAATDEIFEASRQSVRYNPDPLVLDLDSDGISLVSKQLGVYFDEDSKGLKEKTQWIGAEDALLAIDLNNNGIIDGGEELFGTSTVLSDGSLARTGFEALAQYDSNEDGVIDEQDDVFDRLLVWRDSNVDGVTDEGELETLRQHSIESIKLSDGDGDEGERRTTLVQYSDGHTANLSEVDFEADYYDVREKEEIEISDIIKELPNVQAIGNIPSLHTLMQLDESGELQELVEAFMTAETVDEREEICTAIIEKICGADKVADGSRGTEFDAKKLAVIEAFMGREFIGTAGSNPVNTAASLLSGVYDKLYSLYYGLLAKESVLQPYLSLVYMYENDEGKRYIDTSYFDFYAKLSIENEIDMKNLVPEMARFISMMNPDSIENLTDFVKQYADYEGYVDEFSKCNLGILFGTSTEDSISGTGDADTIIAGTGNDILQGNYGSDVLYGNSGDDTLYGEFGDDKLNGGIGSDHMDGGYGADTYVFNLGDGVDTVFDYEYDMTPQDKILFGEGISTDDVCMERQGDNLRVWYSENDSFTVLDAYRNYYGTGRYFVESVEFSDGTIWNTEEIANRANKILGTDGDDTISGFYEAVGYHQDETFHAGDGNDVVNAGEGNDTIYGEDGNDALYGENGNDTLNGGTGSDHMDGGYGSDTYVFNLGDGVDTVFDYEYDTTPQDKILFGEGITVEDVRMERRGNNLVVWYSENDSFTVQDAYRDYYGTGRYFVESVEFADGTVWNTEEIANRANKLFGTEGDDTLVGFGEAVGYHQDETFHAGSGSDQVNAGNGNDILFGEAGNDTLYGENGNDILNGGTGSDHMDGGCGSDTYVFNLGDGVDTVFDYEYDMTPQDRILFGEGISSEDVRMERQGNNLVVWYSENDSFTIIDAYRDYYGTGRYFVESVEFADGTVWDTEEMANRANKILGTDDDDTLVGFGEAVGYHQGETFHAGAGNDQVNAGNGDDVLYGEEGNDTLYGEYGDDTLNGGTGSDHMEGGCGSDTYVFNLGDGVDTVFDYEYDMTPQDKILFGEGISAENVRMERQGNNLVVWYSESDSFTVQDAYREYYGSGRYFVESVEFADGTVWDTEEIANRANKILGTDDDDTLVGFGEAVGYHQGETFHAGAGNDQVNAGNGDDVLYGEEGNDTLYGEYGDDTLNGGTGSDHMEGGCGSDTYVFNLGDGADTVFDYEYDMTPKDRILFGEGISSSDVRMERQGNNLVVWYSESDSFTVQDAYREYYGTGRYFVESVEFVDGTVWDTEAIANRANHLLGTDGDDTINGYAEAVGYHQNETVHGLGGDDQINVGDGDDTVYGDEGNDTIFAGSGQDILIGGAGNDYLDGGTGNDIYRFERGDGVDTIFDFEDSFSEGRADKIIFGNNISIEDISLRREGNDLILDYGENDRITIASAYQIYWGEGKYRVENVDFADGMQTMIDYDNQEMIVTYQPEYMEDVIEENEGLSEDAEATAFADIVDAEAEHMAELMIQEMSGVVEENVSDRITTEQNTAIVDELLWAE